MWRFRKGAVCLEILTLNNLIPLRVLAVFSAPRFIAENIRCSWQAREVFLPKQKLSFTPGPPSLILHYVVCVALMSHICDASLRKPTNPKASHPARIKKKPPWEWWGIFLLHLFFRTCRVNTFKDLWELKEVAETRVWPPSVIIGLSVPMPTAQLQGWVQVGTLECCWLISLAGRRQH